MNVSVALAALNTAAFLLCVSFLAYVALILVPFLRHRPAEPGDPRGFEWHLLIPCRNEVDVIAATVADLRRSVPRAHLWCIDDGSTDGTDGVLEDLRRRWCRVHVVTRRPPDAGRGKGPALNAGWRAVDHHLLPGADRERVIVGVVDADARLAPGALAAIAGDGGFGADDVGAVQIQVRVHTAAEDRRHRLMLRLQDLEFSGPIAAMQALRRRSGSVGMGGNGQFTRLSVLDRVAAGAGTPWHGALLEDFELGLHVLLAGSRTEYCHDTWVGQEGLTHVPRLIRQRSRWAQGSMQCFRYLSAILRSREIPTTGAVELTYFLFLPWLQLLGGVVYVAAAVVMVDYAVTDPGGLGAWWSAGAWAVVPMAVAFGVAPFVVWGFLYRRRAAPELTWRAALGLGLANWLYGYLQQVASWWAFVRVVRSRSDWKKTARATAVDPDVAPPADVPVVAGRFVPRDPIGALRAPARLVVGSDVGP